MSNTRRPEVVVVGAACLDIKGRLLSEPILATSNPAYVRVSIGGAARNIAENLARLGTSTVLLAAVCGDDFGRMIVRHSAASGVNVDHMLLDCAARSASYLALLDQQGQLFIGLDDNIAAEAITPNYILDHADLLRAARLVVIDANVPLAAAHTLLDLCAAAGVPVCLDPVSYRLATRFRDLVGRFYLVTPNAVEAEALTGIVVGDQADAVRASRALATVGVGVAIVTLAHNGLVYATAETQGHIPAIETDIADSTGAGAALAAATIYALLNDIPLDEAVRLGVSAATLTLASPDTVCPTMSLESLYARLVI